MAGRTRLALALVLAIGAAGAWALPGAASTGVSIDVGRIAVTEELAPGGDYRLPTFGVRNPGTEPTTYEIVVTYVDGEEGMQPPEAWFEFSPAQLALGPGETGAVQTRLVVPPTAEEGAYAALIGPQIATAAAADGPRVGAAAAARLTFRVGPASGLEAWLRWLWRLIEQHPWILLVPLAALVVAAYVLLRRRFTISIARRG